MERVRHLLFTFRTAALGAQSVWYRWATFMACGATLWFVAACGSSTMPPTAPSPKVPTVNALTVAGMPAVLAVGQTVQLTASVTLPNGGQKQTVDVTWQSSNPEVATVSSSGAVTATGFGVADILARAYGQSATAHAFAPAPPQIKLTTIIDRWGSTLGLCDATNITFNLSASIGTGPRYDIAYGDGAVSSEGLSRHVYGCKGAAVYRWATPDTYVIRATVTDVLGRTDTATSSIAVIPFTGIADDIWYNYAPKPTVEVRYLRFDPGSVRHITGQYYHPSPYGVSNLNGTISGDNDVDMVLVGGGIRMTGSITVNPGYDSHMDLTFAGGSANGLTLVFAPYSLY
jgi:hypothetical protein